MLAKTNFYTTEKIGNTLHLTPEKYLICENVPIARTGEMLYSPQEILIASNGTLHLNPPDGIVRVTRDSDEVFRKETIESIQGKPIVDGHPDEDVDVDNWKSLAKGIVINPRRGQGADDDLLIADFIVTDSDAIKAILNGTKEVSCGYTCDYEKISHNAARQRMIRVNHVAFLDAGRCGQRCSIGDKKTVDRPVRKTRRTVMKWFDKLKKAVDSGDQSATAAVIEEISETATDRPEIHTHVHLRDNEKEKEKEEEKKETHDSTMDAMSKDIKTIRDAVGSMDERLKKVEGKFHDESEEEKKKKEEEEKEKEGKKTEDDEIEFEAEAPAGSGDKAWKKTKDSAFMAESWQEMVSMAEIIMPGIQAPTFDAKMDKGKTLDAFCAFRRRVLAKASDTQPDVNVYLDSITRNRTLDKLSCGEVRTAFNAVASMKRALNNDSLRPGERTQFVGKPVGAINSIAELNKRNQELYK
jgi:hypothetical protein